MNTILTDDELPPLQPQDHPEPHSMRWSDAELRAIRARDRLVEAAVLARLREQGPVANDEGWLPCPFCGSNDVCEVLGDGTEGSPEFFVQCSKCNGSGDSDKWNDRAAPLSAVVQVPPGYKLVPVEPTEQMLSALRGPGPRVLPAYVGAQEKADAREKARYAAMLEAAPIAPTDEATYHAWAGDIADEATLRRAVSVMDDVLTDIADWEDKTLAEAVDSCRAELLAMADGIAMVGGPEAPAQAIPAPWREAVKVAQKPIGWVLVNKDGELVGWHNTVHTFDPSEGGFSDHPTIADANDPDGEPHRWVQVAAIALADSLEGGE